MSLHDLPVPDSPAAVAALEVSRAYSSPALVNHCLRSYVYAADLACAPASGSTPSCSTSRPCFTTSD